MLTSIFFIFFKIGLFTIGGGYAMLPVIQREIVSVRGWMSEEEFLDAISLTNSLPGPLATNCAAFLGYRLKRIPGALSAVLGAISPSVVIILSIAAVFHNIMDNPYVQYVFCGIRPAVVALIFYAVIKLAKSAQVKQPINAALALASFGSIAFFQVHPTVIILCAALIGVLLKGNGSKNTTNSDNASAEPNPSPQEEPPATKTSKKLSMTQSSAESHGTRSSAESCVMQASAKSDMIPSPGQIPKVQPSKESCMGQQSQSQSPTTKTPEERSQNKQ